MKTEKGYNFFEVASAIQKAIRRGDEDTAMFFAVEMFNSKYDEYVWKRLKIISSEDVGLAQPGISTEIQSLYAMYTDQKKKKDEKNAPERLFLTHAVIMLCRAQKSRLVDWSLINYWNAHAEDNREMPDYAYDKHNQKGRSMGRGVEHFYNEGTKLIPHAMQEREAEMKEAAFSTEKGKKAPELFEDEET